MSVERRFCAWTRGEAITPALIAAASPGALRDNPPAADLIVLVAGAIHR